MRLEKNAFNPTPTSHSSQDEQEEKKINSVLYLFRNAIAFLMNTFRFSFSDHPPKESYIGVNPLYSGESPANKQLFQGHHQKNPEK